MSPIHVRDVTYDKETDETTIVLIAGGQEVRVSTVEILANRATVAELARQVEETRKEKAVLLTRLAEAEAELEAAARFVNKFIKHVKKTASRCP